MTWQTGGGAPLPNPLPGKELAYAQIINNFVQANVAVPTAVPGLSVTFTPPTGSAYYLECFINELNEDSGSTAGDLVTAVISQDNATDWQQADAFQAPRGVGSSIYMKTQTLTGDGLPHTFTIFVNNITNAANGIIVNAGGQFPAFIRAVAC